MITKTCSLSGKEFVVTDEDLAFYEKMGVPAPTLCPEERLKQRLVLRNRRKMYRRKCDATGKSLISMFHDSGVFPVYDLSEWQKDLVFDPLEYGRDFDFSRSFFEQFEELCAVVPHPHASVQGLAENSEYCNGFTDCKDCYLAFSMWKCEDIMYSHGLFDSRDLTDCLDCSGCELCFGCIGGTNLYDCVECDYSKNCSSCYFCVDCIGCNNCFGCANLRSKEYYFLNQKCTKQEYEKKIEAIVMGSSVGFEKMKVDALNFLAQFPKKYARVIQCEKSTGDLLIECKNCQDCYDVRDAEDCRYCMGVSHQVKDCMDYSFWGANAELCYGCCSCGSNAFELRFCVDCWEVRNLTYCYYCKSVTDCFGCFGLKGHKKYCILNKQYSKEEYFELRDRIIAHMKKTGEWGEFFPASLSSFGYNETEANNFFPLERKDALDQGFLWRDDESNLMKASGYEIPDLIEDVEDGVLDEILLCEVTGKPYRIIDSELRFYKKMHLPLPRVCPDERQNQRIARRNPRMLWNRECNGCKCKIESSYAPERKEKVLCEECYLKIVD